MEIRLGTIADIAAIMRIVDSVVKEMKAGGNFQWNASYPTDETFEQDIAANSLHVGVLDEELVSFITLDTNQPAEYDPIPWNDKLPAIVLHRFAVAPKARRQRVAERMEAFASEHTRAQGFRYIRTDTNSANTVMQRFLASRDYQFAGRLFFPKCDNPFFCYDKILK